MTHTPGSPTPSPAWPARGAWRRPAALAIAAAAAVVLLLACASRGEARQHVAPSTDAQPAPHGEVQAAEQPPTAAPAGHHGEAAAEGHGESPWALVARIFNFALLAGALVYLLRSPLVGFLEQRGTQVRSGLADAASLRAQASAELDRIEEKMRALPGDIDALKRRGAEEIAAEEARIKALAESERRRLLDQAAREIDTELRVAERDLQKRAGELAVAVATERVKRTITDRDHARLVEKYVAQVRQ